MSQYITKLINTIFRTGSYPNEESKSMIITLYKGKGNTSLGENYRGISIISVISKIYATMINHRLTEWRSGDISRQARGQAGFTKSKRTTDHMFLLEHVIHKYTRGSQATKKNGKRLYTCFVDLAKAFDTINRTQLWGRLEELGIHGTMLNATKSYYANIRECVRTPAGLTDEFESNIGVKQGCPLSPTLFGFFMDKIETYMKLALPTSSIQIWDELVPLLFYADDIVCLASSEAELQNMVNIFSCFCTKYGLTLNVSKTKTMVFGGQGAQTGVNIAYRGQTLTQVDEFRYLGITFHWSKGSIHGGGVLSKAAKGAMHALISHTRSENILDIRLLCKLFDSLISPILLYGCEIWGHCRKLTNTVDSIYTGFLKRIIGVRIDSNVVLAELKQTPMRLKKLKRQCLYWNRLINLSDSSLLHKATLEQLTWFKKDAVRDRKCWMVATARAAHASQAALLDTECEPPNMQVTTLQQLINNHERDTFHNHALRSTCHEGSRDFYASELFIREDNFRSVTYAQWFWRSGSPLEIANSVNMRTLIRFRVGAHKLQVVVGAWVGVPRNHRICKCCNMNIVEDEFHMVFECLLYDQARHEHIDLFTITGNSHNNLQHPLRQGTAFTPMHARTNCAIIIDNKADEMRRFFDYPNQGLLASFIGRCLKVRKHSLNQ